jgi:hypothetical protein
MITDELRTSIVKYGFAGVQLRDVLADCVDDCGDIDAPDEGGRRHSPGADHPARERGGRQKKGRRSLDRRPTWRLSLA